MSALEDKALLELTRQANEAEGYRHVLASALRDIEDIALENVDLDSPWNAVVHILSTGGVKLAMNPSQ